MTALFFSPIIPQAMLLGLLGTVFNYWAAKISLLRHAQMPEMFSELIISFFSNFLPYIVLLWAGAFLYYPVRMHHTVQGWRDDYKFEALKDT